jgi:hypothetical protein
MLRSLETHLSIIFLTSCQVYFFVYQSALHRCLLTGSPKSLRKQSGLSQLPEGRAKAEMLVSQGTPVLSGLNEGQGGQAAR